MPLQLTTIKISGVPSENGWSQSFEYPIIETEPKNTQALVIVFSTGVKSLDVQGVEMGRELLKKFHDAYFENAEKSPVQSLKDATNKVFNDFFQNFDGLEISSAAYSGGSIYVSSLNGGKVSLYRDKFLVKILDSVTPKLISASGHPEDGDFLILSTSAFHDQFSGSDIKNNLDMGLDAFTDEVSLKTHSISQSSVLLMAFGHKGKIERAGGFMSGIRNRLKNENLSRPSDEKPIVTPENGSQETSSSIPIKPTHGFFGIFSDLKNKMPEFIPKRRIFLHIQKETEFPIRNKKVALVGILLFILLLVSVSFGLMKKSKDDYKKTYSDRLTEAQTSIDDAVRLADIEVTKSREFFLKGRGIVSELKKEGVPENELEELVNKIESNKSKILGEIKAESKLWLDLTLISDGFNSDNFSLDDGDLYVFDASKKVLLSIDIGSKKSSTLRVPSEIGTPKHVVSKNKNIYVLGGDGVYDFSKKQKVIDKSWSGEAFLSAFASNLYILDREEGEVSKSTGAETGFSELKKWTTSEKEDFSEVNSFVIDGFAWVLRSNREVLKFSYGNKIGFELKGYPYELPGYDRLFTDEATEDLYLLDREGKTISVFSKDGDYKFNLMTDVVADTNDLIVTDDNKTILLLTGEKLYEVRINK